LFPRKDLNLVFSKKSSTHSTAERDK